MCKGRNVDFLQGECEIALSAGMSLLGLGSRKSTWNLAATDIEKRKHDAHTRTLRDGTTSTTTFENPTERLPQSCRTRYKEPETMEMVEHTLTDRRVSGTRAHAATEKEQESGMCISGEHEGALEGFPGLYTD